MIWAPQRQKVTLREAAPRGVSSPARAVLSPQFSAVNKPASNRGDVGKGRAWGRPRDREETERGLELTHGLVERMHGLGYMEDRGTTDILVLSIHYAGAIETVVPGVSYHTVGGYCLETGWWWRYGLLEEDRSRTVRR